jgi:hypothetical protein
MQIVLCTYTTISLNESIHGLKEAKGIGGSTRIIDADCICSCGLEILSRTKLATRERQGSGTGVDATRDADLTLWGLENSGASLVEMRSRVYG